MHLLVLAEDFYPNTSGGAYVRWRFCQLAVERGHDITVFTPHKDGLARAETVDGVSIHRPFPVKPASVPTYAPLAVVTRIVASVLFFVYLLWWLREQDVDGLHSASHLTHWVGKALSVLYDLPLVTFVGYTPSLEPEPSRSPQLLLERVNFRLFMGDTVFCRTPAVQEVIERYTDSPVQVLHGILNRERITEIASTVDRDQRRAELGVAANETLLVFVGRLVPIKNPAGAIKVVSELPSKYTLAVVGDGDEREAVERAVREHDVEDRVQLCGALPHEATLATISAADGLLLPSHTEAYPTVVFEALALNSAAFVTPVGILPTIDHPQLHVGTVDEFPRLIIQSSSGSSGGLDTETLELFSMERYTDELCTAFDEQATDNTGTEGA